MTIQYLQDLSRAAAAVYLYLDPPDGPSALRLVRRYDATFPALPTGTGNHQIYAGPPTGGVLDWHEVLPGTTHWYAPYYLTGATWTLGTAHSITPTIQTHAPTLDSLDAIRERVEVGLNALLADGYLRHPRNQFSVLTAPLVLEDVCFPAVAVHLDQATADQHFVGGYIGSDLVPSGQVSTSEGWWARYQVQVEAWSLNPDERRLLRRALRDILVSGRDVLELIGLMELEVSLADNEDFQSYNAPLYHTVAKLTYLAPDVIWSEATPLRDITFSADITGEAAADALLS